MGTPQVVQPLQTEIARSLSATSKVRIQDDKFFPPQFNADQFLARERIIDFLLQKNSPRIQCIVVEAQPGQGKTTTIKQYLDRANIASAWYRVGEEDTDPGYFLQTIPACLNTFFPDCPSAATARILASSDLTAFDVPKRLDLLLQDLNGCLADDLYLVFDDLHHLLDHPASLSILDHLIGSAPAKLHFVLLSREPLTGLQHLPTQSSLLRLDSDILAMDELEITDYFHRILGLDVPLDLAREVSRVTGGWAMGVRLLGLHLEQHHYLPNLTLPTERFARSRLHLLEYFGREVFDVLDRTLHQPLLLLSLLDEIPVALAAEITGRDNIDVTLNELARRNLFLRSLTADNTIYSLHHCFQQFLQDKARSELKPEAIHRVYELAGTYYLDQSDPAQAIHFLLLAEEYRRIDALLRENGMALLAVNRGTTLGTLLNRVPETYRKQMGWISFIQALTMMDSTPTRAFPLLEQALTTFSACGDEIGELLSLSHSISVRIVTTGHYQGGEPLLYRAVELFSRAADSLDAATTILVARNLAMGYCIFLADVDEANRYGSLALTLARKEHLVNYEAALLMVMGYIRIFAGHTALTKMYLEQAAPFINHSEVGTFNRLAIRMMLFNFLFHNGDFSNYFIQKHQLIDAFGLDLVAQSIAGPFCYIWEMDIALNHGDTATVLKLADQALAQQPAFGPHLTSQILQLKGVALALQEQTDQALAAANDSRELREQAGGPYFIALNKLLVGLIHGLCGLHQQGIVLLDEGIADARRMPTEYLEACGHFHRAEVLLDAGQDQRALRDLESGIRLLHRNGYSHFWAWTPRAMTRSLALAVQHGYEPAFAKRLATYRLHLSLLDDGTPIPQLDIQVLGDIRINRQGTPLLEAEDLTPTQRELLALLLSAPGLKMPQESICLHFWPDSSQNTVRIKFDTLISRLRKTLADALMDNTAALYLNRDKGMLWLAHCRIDAHRFLDGAKKGMVHYRLQEFWQAGNIFTAIEPLWQGEFAPGATGDDRMRFFRDSLNTAHSEMAIAWSDLLVRSDRLADAIGVVNKALLYDPLNDRLYALLYRLEGQRSAVHARRVLDRFKSVLLHEGFCDDETVDLVQRVSTSHPISSPFLR